MRGGRSFFLVLSALFGTGIGSRGQEAPGSVELKGTVVDEEGRPVPGIMVGCQWNAEGDRLYPDWRADSTTEGRFYLDLGQSFTEGVEILAFDKAGGRAGMARYDPSRKADPLVIRLAPAGRVRGEVGCPELKETPRRFEVVAYQESGTSVLLTCLSTTGSFDFPLPLGSYVLAFHAEEFERNTWEFRLTKAKPVAELGTLAVEPNLLARHFDKVPPEWKATHAQKAAPGVKPADFRGRWTLVCFWRHESGAPALRCLKEMHALHREYADVEESFAVLGFHYGSAADLDELHRKLGDADFRFT